MGMDRRRMGGYLSLRDAIDQLFEDSVISPSRHGGGGNFPPVDIHVSDDHLEIQFAVPGADPDAIDISVTGDVVTVSGEVKRDEHTQGTGAYHEEIWRGKFQRSFQLPIQVDPAGAEATFEHGVLHVTLPKSEATRPRKIQVQKSGGSSGGEETAQVTQG